MKIFSSLTAFTHHPHGVDCQSDGGWRLRVRAPAPHLLRLVIEPPEGLAQKKSWMVAPEGEVPWQGRDREDLAGFAPPPIRLETIAGGLRMEAGAFRLTLTGAPLRSEVEQRVAGQWRPWIADRATGGFASTDGEKRLRHFQTRARSDRYFGLGDKSGPLDRHGRRFRCLQLDALGYDAEIGDPLYKHVPFFIARTGGDAHGVAGGLFYDSLVPLTFDLGCERSNYHGLYRYVEAEEAGLDLWLIAGPDVAAVTRHFTALTGLPPLPPRWSFGFAFTTMHHADDARAQAVMSDFLDRCRVEAIPLSALHFGSGYSSRGKRRYVFTWNREKYPDPAALFAKLRAMGLPSVANLKPVLIDDHPDYADIAASGGFVKTASGEPVLEQFWDGMGSYLDFTNPATIARWQERLKAQVLDIGFDAGWNDNNEYEIGREGALASGFGAPYDATTTRPLHALLMTRASYEATKAAWPERRPFTITRAGPAGLQRYAETWTGDNETSWHSLKWNLQNGLSLALSGQSKVGHDIGGFTGPRPSPELLCRFVEMMALHPRAVMNSWKPEVAPDWQAATHPWTHPEVLAQIKAALDLRTRFLPLLYSLAFAAHKSGDAIIRPLFYDFPEDPGVYAPQDALMLGPDVLFSPVVEEGTRHKTQYLPNGPKGWVEFHSGIAYPAGALAEVGAELGEPPLFVRAGAALVLAAQTPFIAPHDAPARLIFLAFVGEKGTGRGWHFEDDGTSFAYQSGDFLALDLRFTWDRTRVELVIARAGGTRPIPPVSAWQVDIPGLGGREVQISIRAD